ncbi:hypothetical protein LJC32_00895 [Oscillospiraceae bacterium OttesenSCG-928-F05]|nr:hypothetical protein [Oscillospiraceae bacterium OttesenSCG-928-F05]
MEKMKGYKINFAANTITITAAFQAAANDLNTEEYRILKQIQTDYPAMRIVRKTHRSPKACNPSKGLTYANMERYIMVYQNAAELLEVFEQVKELAAIQPNGYSFVKSWFVKQFPNYNKLPDFTSINKVIEVVPAFARVEEDDAA